jgi:hypothetical protein
MSDEQYINEQFQEMRGLGYTVTETIDSLKRMKTLIRKC